MTWKEAVLQVIQERNGREITLNEIYEGVKILPVMRVFHEDPWQPGKQPKYECWVRSVLAKLKQERLVTHVSKGIYKSN